jgi:hypothetical protein
MELLPKTRVELHIRVRLGRQALEDIVADEAQEQLPSSILLAFAPIHRMAMGIAGGAVLGGFLFLLTMILVIKGGYPVGPRLALLGHFFFGYEVTFLGAFIGLLWGFVAGFMLGWGFAVVRNIAVWLWLTVIRSRAEMEQYGDFLDHM